MFILDTAIDDPYSDSYFEKFKISWEEYRKYLNDNKSIIPVDAYELALAEWHYNANDPRALHDCWVDKMSIREDVNDDGRVTNLSIELLGAYHDRKIYLEYIGVYGYIFDSFSNHVTDREVNVFDGHGDWLIDEIRVSKKGKVLHEILFRGGARWVIESDNILHSEKLIEIEG